MIKNDIWIKEQAAKGMIKPFVPASVRELKTFHKLFKPDLLFGSVELDFFTPPKQIVTDSQKVISYGLSSYGYDIRLSSKDFRVFRHIPGTIVDPKNFNPDNLEAALLHRDEQGDYFILPAHSYGLGVALERLQVPENVSVICIGKSTYARIGVIANLTPAESGWHGHLTLEFSNSSSADCRVYANEGVCQLLFFEGDPCEVSYSDRNGKYQGQNEEITLAKV